MGMKGKQAILEPQEPRCLYLKTKNKNANLIFFQGCRLKWDVNKQGWVNWKKLSSLTVTGQRTNTKVKSNQKSANYVHCPSSLCEGGSLIGS